ncbi:unnamed protein product, partial [Symbiodinium sp. KB8]
MSSVSNAMKGRGSQMLAGSVRVLLYVRLLVFVSAVFDLVHYTSWAYEVLARRLVSVLVVLLLRYWGGGVPAAAKELQGIASDFSHIARTALLCYHASWSEAFKQGMISACLMFRYTNYGPFGHIFDLLVVAPVAAPRRLFKLFASRANYFEPPLSDSEWYHVVGMEAPRCLVLLVAGFGLAIYCENLVHRYFGHRVFSTSRAWNLVLAAIPCYIAMPPLFFASTHRRHHKYCEEEGDPHPVNQKGFLYGAMFWLADRENFKIREEYIPDWLEERPELLVFELWQAQIAMGVSYVCVALLSIFLAPVWFPENLWESPFMVAFLTGKTLGTAMVAAFTAFGHTCPFWPACLPLRWPFGSKGDDPPKAQGSQEGLGPCMSTHRSWYWWMAGSESDHDQHHACPIYAVYGPWYHDWSYCTYAAMEKCGLVWSVKTPWAKGWKPHRANASLNFAVCAPAPRAQPDVVETVPLKPTAEDPSAELRRLVREAESALKKQDPRRALDFARGASGAAQKAKEEATSQEPPRADPLFRAPPQPPSDGAKEVKQLLAACGLEVRALLALRRFPEASEVTQSALKMQSWEAERLERDFDCPDALRSLEGLMESLRHVAEATGA